MEIGENIYIKIEKKYGENKFFYRKGKIFNIYPNYILVEFSFKNKNNYKEGFNPIGLIYKKEEELDENDYIL